MSRNEFQSMADHHVHAQEIRVNDVIAAERLGVDPGDARWSCPPVREYVNHVLRDDLDIMWLIYEDPKRFIEIRLAIHNIKPACIVNGFFYVREPRSPNIDGITELFNQGLMQGIKLHPVNDNYQLLPENVDPVIQIAERFGLPVIFHSDDRLKTMDLTSPKNQEILVTAYPKVIFLIGHGGAYASPRLVGENPQVKAYWNTRGPIILAALKLSLNSPNVFYETSVLSNRIKAKIVADFINENPEAADRILIGTDFPIKLARTRTQLEALQRAGLDPRLVAQVSQNRLRG